MAAFLPNVIFLSCLFHLIDLLFIYSCINHTGELLSLRHTFLTFSHFPSCLSPSLPPSLPPYLIISTPLRATVGKIGELSRDRKEKTGQKASRSNETDSSIQGMLLRPSRLGDRRGNRKPTQTVKESRFHE